MLERIPIIRSFFGSNSTAAYEVSKRWANTVGRDPDLKRDLLIQGRVFAVQPVEMVDGIPQVTVRDERDLAYEQGWRDFAVLLLAQSGVTIDELSELMEVNNVR